VAFKWPKSIQVGVRDIKIKYCNRKQFTAIHKKDDPDERLLARALFYKDEIHICTEEPISWRIGTRDIPRNRRDILCSLLHEVVHFIDNEYNCDLDGEPEVNVWANEITKFMRSCNISLPAVREDEK